MIQISREVLSLIFLEVSLGISDRKTFGELLNQAKAFTDDYAALVGIGQVDFLLMLHGSLKTHPLIDLPNIRLASAIRCHGLQGRSTYSSGLRNNAATMVSCLKVNPKVISEKGFAALSTIFLPSLEQIGTKFASSDLTTDVYLTLGWPDIVLIITARDLDSALDALSEIRSIPSGEDSPKRFFLSTSFSELFLKHRLDGEELVLDGEISDSKFDFYMKVYCKPGGHISVADNLKDYNPFFLLGKKDLGIIRKSIDVAEYARFVLDQREKNKKFLYATKTDIFFARR